MAKSMRSKSKRSFRRTKRESGVFAAADAARLERLNRKLAAKVNADKDGDAPMKEEEQVEVQEGTGVAEVEGEDATMSGEREDATSTTPKRISTSGPRGSRREEWRKSKGMAPRSKSQNRMNKHGVIASSKRSGRSKRRR
ncbi:hypothetical protein FRC08_012950 [Ceratobasidium sp. 394]|nr:hypothetical protein FRC08_012950 [Ceratobasidium sp. 394]